MREFAKRLAKHHAALGGERVDPPVSGFSAEGEVVLVGEITSQAELEAAFSSRRTVAGPHVTAGLAKGGDHVATEADGRRLLEPLDLHRRLHLDAPTARDDRGRAVAPGDDSSLGRDHGDLRVFRDPLEGSRQVAGGSIGVGRRDDQLARRSTPLQDGVRRRDRHRGRAADQSGRVARACRRGARGGCASQNSRNSQGPRSHGPASVHRSLLSGRLFGRRAVPLWPLATAGHRGGRSQSE